MHAFFNSMFVYFVHRLDVPLDFHQTFIAAQVHEQHVIGSGP